MGSFKIVRFPLPPSVNALYSSIGHSGRRVKSKAYLNYQRSVYNWLGSNLEQVKVGRSICSKVNGTKAVLEVNATFYMEHRSIRCKDGRPKRNDTSNRLKALHDALSDIVLGIDDSYFWNGTFKKVSVDDPKLEGVDIEFIIIGGLDGTTDGEGIREVGARDSDSKVSSDQEGDAGGGGGE